MALEAALWAGYSQALTERLSQYCEGWDAGLDRSPSTGYKWGPGEGKVDWSAVVKAFGFGAAILGPTSTALAHVQAKLLERLQLSGNPLRVFTLLWGTFGSTPITVAVYCFANAVIKTGSVPAALGLTKMMMMPVCKKFWRVVPIVSMLLPSTGISPAHWPRLMWWIALLIGLDLKISIKNKSIFPKRPAPKPDPLDAAFEEHMKKQQYAEKN
eukprot:TRINITY_DN2568_c0_g1_i1.p1 TRINITY_DN2568_c0_g1~~TRINITY_DN2568_c0_g1_i1.p1  ORF type:complete len:213 (-),score=51.19 TRINITY_DN2568_c0_g1_i1:466-1104(-)